MLRGVWSSESNTHSILKRCLSIITQLDSSKIWSAELNLDTVKHILIRMEKYFRLYFGFVVVVVFVVVSGILCCFCLLLTYLCDCIGVAVCGPLYIHTGKQRQFDMSVKWSPCFKRKRRKKDTKDHPSLKTTNPQTSYALGIFFIKDHPIFKTTFTWFMAVVCCWGLHHINCSTLHPPPASIQPVLPLSSHTHTPHTNSHAHTHTHTHTRTHIPSANKPELSLLFLWCEEQAEIQPFICFTCSQDFYVIF